MLADAETRYTTTEQEALAVVRCLAEVCWLVLGARFPTKVYTDHSALITLLKHDDAHGRTGKWQVKLAKYDLQYVHVPGSQNVIADGLSRLPARYFDQWNDDPAKLNNREGVGTGVEGSLGGGKTELGMVAAISVEEKERWGRWLESGWYGQEVRFLLAGTLEGEDLTARGRRLIRQQAARYRIYDR